MKKLLVATTLALGLGAASTASAQEVYDWPSTEAPVVVHDGGSVLFIGKDKTVWRTYGWKAAKGKNRLPLLLIDVDADGKPNVVGAGKPTFILNHDAVPQWDHPKGCDQVLVANVLQAKGKELICVRGANVDVYSFDGQFVWGASVGRSIEYCHAGDINGDLAADVECKIKGSKTYTRFDGTSGEVLAQSTDANELSETEMDLFEPAKSEDVLSGKTKFDLNGDGTAEESLLAVDDKAVAIQSKSKKTAMGRIETGSKPIAAIVKDLDGDKKLDIVIVTKKNIFISDAAAKNVKKFAISSRKYKRQSVAQLDSVYANGFADDAAATKSVNDLNSKLAKCYSGQVRKNQFAGQGKLLMGVTVNAKGKVTNVNLTHTELTDKKVVSCAQNVLKKGKYPKAAGDSATVNVHLFYTFRDE